MGLKRRVFQNLLIVPVFAMLCGAVWAQSTPSPSPTPSPQSPSKDNSFSDSVASELLDRFVSGLVTRNQRKLLGACDFARMSDGARFQQQINSFLAQAGTIRIHYSRLRTSSEGAKGVATAMVEMEADSRDENILPVHKQAQLRLLAENTAAGWRFTDVQPREFFSTQP
jgi:hypothetical protein